MQYSRETIKNKILSYLAEEGRYTHECLASMLGTDVQTVDEIISEAENNGEILSYGALINWEKCGKESVTAFIELKTIPQRDLGFDAIAQRICSYPEVKGVMLMSGGFDLGVTAECRTMRDVAVFVAERLATIDGVTSTATHFVMQKYKDSGIVFESRGEDKRGNE